jgi:hypothetical protein
MRPIKGHSSLDCKRAEANNFRIKNKQHDKILKSDVVIILKHSIMVSRHSLTPIRNILLNREIWPNITGDSSPNLEDFNIYNILKGNIHTKILVLINFNGFSFEQVKAATIDLLVADLFGEADSISKK